MWTKLLFGPALLGVETAKMLLDAQAVIAMRTAGMMGLWRVGDGENATMMSEKPAAMMKSGLAMQQAMMSGETPDQVLRAGLEPIRKRAGKNARRLAAKGPRLPGS